MCCCLLACQLKACALPAFCAASAAALLRCSVSTGSARLASSASWPCLSAQPNFRFVESWQARKIELEQMCCYSLNCNMMVVILMHAWVWGLELSQRDVGVNRAT
jgi:hypothetical protein